MSPRPFPKRKPTLSSRKDERGRSTTTTGIYGFVQLHRWMLECPAWQELTVQSRAIYVELERRYRPGINGRIPLSARDAAAACKISKNTATRCFFQLSDLGFIECVKLGRFSMKVQHATEWLLTVHRNDINGMPPRKSFMKWRPAVAGNLEHGPKSGTPRSQIRDREAA